MPQNDGGDDPGWEDLDDSGYSDWEIQILQELYGNGGQYAVDGVWYIINNSIHIRIGEPYGCSPGRPGRCVGDWQSQYSISGWYEGDNYIFLHPQHNAYDKMPSDWDLSIVVHEALHIEQGLMAFTKDSELEAYKVGVQVFMSLSGKSFSQLDPSQQILYNSTSGWDYGQNVKQYLPEYWTGLQLLPPYWP